MENKKSYINSFNIENSYKTARNFHEKIYSLCNPNAYNLFLNKHLGDIFYAIGTKKEFEDINKTKLHFIVRAQHEFIMKMYGIDDYTTIDVNKDEKEIINYKLPYLVSSFNKTDSFDVICKDLFQSIPVKGFPFILDSSITTFHLFDRFWSYLWAQNIGVDIDNFKYSIPKHKLDLSLDVEALLKKIAPLEKIVLFAPDASTAIEFPSEFWNIIANRVHAHGYKIIVNSNKYKIEHGHSAFELGLSLQDVVSLGLSCAYVFSVRTGLCDVLVGAGKKLYAFYPAMLHREMNGLTKCFEPKTHVNEIAIWRWKIDKVIWEEEDLTLPLQKYINKLHFGYIKEKIKYILTWVSRHHGKRHKLLYRDNLNLAGKSKVFSENNKENIAHKFYDPKISFLGLPIYSRKFKNEKYGHYTVRHNFFGGLIQLKLFSDLGNLRLRFLGLQIFHRGEGKNKLLGINIYKYNAIKKWLNNIQKQINKEYDDIYFIRHNIGESYVELMYLAEMIKINKSKKPLLILYNKKYLGFYNMFLPVHMDMQFIELSQNSVTTIFHKKEVINYKNQRFICRGDLIAQNMKKHLLVWPDINFHKYIMKEAGVEDETKYTLPKPSLDAKRKVDSKIKQINLKDKFVILLPESNTLVSVENEFWKALTKNLQNKGYDVFVNIYDKDMNLENTKTAKMTIEEIFILAQKSQGIISLGSGISVFLTAAEVKMDLLYTKFATKNVGYSPELAIQIYSVHHLPNVSKSLVKEHNMALIKKEELLNNILDRY